MAQLTTEQRKELKKVAEALEELAREVRRLLRDHSDEDRVLYTLACTSDTLTIIQNRAFRLGKTLEAGVMAKSLAKYRSVWDKNGKVLGE